MRPVPSLLLSALFAASLGLSAPGVAIAQQPAPAAKAQKAPAKANPEAEKRGLTSPEVQKSQDPQPTAQGTRPPNAETKASNTEALYVALQAVRTAPPSIEGAPVPRPNDLGSEPADEPGSNPQELDDLFPENYIE